MARWAAADREANASVRDDSNASHDRVLLVRSDDRQWALPLARVIQVAATDRLIRLPHAPEIYRGAAVFRGRVVPVLDLARLHGTPDTAIAMVAIVELHGQVMGLGLSDIEGVLLATRSTVEILDLDKIELPPATPRPVRSGANGRREPDTRASPAERGLGMTIEGREFWLPLAHVDEVVQDAAPIDVPWADPRAPAIVIHGGDTLALVRIDRLLGLEASRDGPVVIAYANGGRIAFRVDEIAAIIERGLKPVVALSELLAQLPGGDKNVTRLPAPAVRTAEDPWLAIVLERQPCLLPLRMVRSVAAGSRPTALPAGAPRALTGVRAIGGRILPVVDQRQALGLTANEPQAVDIVVAPRDAPQFILSAQQIDGIVRLRPDMVRGTGSGTMIDGVVRLGQRLAWLLSPSGLSPSGFAPSGFAPSGLAPSGLAPSGLAPSGLAPSGLAPSGLAPMDEAAR
jgi:chemotaxis signal transduction protein